MFQSGPSHFWFLLEEKQFHSVADSEGQVSSFPQKAPVPSSVLVLHRASAEPIPTWCLQKTVCFSIGSEGTSEPHFYISIKYECMGLVFVSLKRLLRSNHALTKNVFSNVDNNPAYCNTGKLTTKFSFAIYAPT